MVDFESERTVGTPASDIVRILILQRRADLFEAWEKYKKQSYMNVQADLSVVRARLYTFFLELQAGFKRRMKEKDYKKIKSQISSEDEEEVLAAIYFMNEELDKLKLIRIDTKKSYDKTRVEAEHKIKKM